jgi:hypothetical protein
MFVCAHYENRTAEVNETPLAVPFAWFMLGALLLTFDGWLLTLAGLLLMLRSGKSLYIRARLALCCLKAARRAEARGEKYEPCVGFEALV